MIVIPREICRDIAGALTHEWLIRNDAGGYASATITGALTRRQHGLLVSARTGVPTVLLAKLDEELEVEGRVYKLGTNEYLKNVISPEGFLYLQQVTYDGVIANFEYEAGRFQLTKTVWMESLRATTYIRYTLAGHSAPARLTLLPLCDYRSTDHITQGTEAWHFQVDPLPQGIRVSANADAEPYSLFTEPRAPFTPLDLWYWRFQLRADQDAGLDLFVPGLFRTELAPGASVTLIATGEADDAVDFDVPHTFANAGARAVPRSLPGSDTFTPEIFSAP